MRSNKLFSTILAGFALGIPAMAIPAMAMPPIQPTTAIQSNNTTGFKLMREAVKSKKTAENTLVSPISAHFALSMALNGASGTTGTDFFKALGYERGTVTGINVENKQLLADLSVKPLSDAEKKRLEAAGEKLPPTVSINNSLWSTNGKSTGKPYSFDVNYVKAIKDSYDIGKPTSLDFKAEKSADVINTWTKEKTFGMIPTIIDSDTLKELIWAIINTTYVEGQWEKPFGAPYKDEFTTAAGKKIKAETMSKQGYMRYDDNGKVQIVELEMHKSTLKTYLVLPNNPADFDKMRSADDGIWSTATWEAMLSNLKLMPGALSVPKFTFEYGVELKKNQDLTKAMGLNFLYQDSADFSKMDGPGSEPSKIGLIKQNTKIEFGQFGVKAAAATIVGGVARSAIIRKFAMHVDRPFFFAIYDEKTQAFLFLGQVVDPK